MTQVITANRLADGIVVFWGQDGSWVEAIGASRLYDDAASVAHGLAETKKGEDDNLVIDVYAIEVADRSGTVTPVRMREAIRATGPTIHPEHGKGQASGKRR